MHSHVLLFLLFFFICGGSHGRRLLHHPFFPLTSSRPPAQPPSFAFPKYPSSINQNPFFPSNPASPPPPSSINQKTFPANISSLNRPSSHSPNTKLLQAIAFPILSLALLSLLLLLFFRRRSHCKGRSEITEGSDSDRLFPPNSGPASSDFLYLGTLLSSRSPELRPLPPLPKPGRSSSEEFYSPTGSPGQKRRSTVSSLTAPSCPSSNTASSPSSSPPAGSSPNAAFFRPPLPPPPPPPSALQTEKAGQIPKPKLKPLHWDKVKASSNRAMIWDQMKASSFQLNEEMIETLFVYDMKKMSTPSAVRENKVLDAKKSQNIAILLRALNVTKEEVCEALSDGNTDALGNELLETLLRMAPSNEEELELREYNDNSPFKLGPAEKFLKAMLEIPFAFKRVEAMHYVANFDIEIYYLKKSFETLEASCEELRNSRLFLKLLEAVLKTGNRMNVGTSRGDAQAFKLDTLLKLVDVKAADGKTTLLHFVVQEIIKAEGSRHSNAVGDDLECRRLGLQIVSRLGNDLGNVKNSASMDCDALSSSVLKLARGIGKVRDIIRLNEAQGPAESNQRFHSSMIGFLRKAEVEVATLQTKESVALSLVREITEYFHGNSAKEAHPFRIFMIVRDFLSILDQVCKEIGRFNERTTFITSAQVVGHTTLPAFPKFPAAERPGCFNDESSL